MTLEKNNQLLLDGLTDEQKAAVCSDKRRVLVVAGAGSGKTEIMARRIAWWVAVEGVDKNKIVAFTFTDRAAGEMKFRIRSWMERVTPAGGEVSLGDMYIGTIHGFCLGKLRELWPDEYHNYDILDEAGRTALVLRSFHGLLGLKALQQASSATRKFGQYETVDSFFQAYDQIHEHNKFRVELPVGEIPYRVGSAEQEWCKKAKLLTDAGDSPRAVAFADSAARYYAYLRCRRFLDFSTSQTEFVRRLGEHPQILSAIADNIHLVVDEIQDINPVQRDLIVSLTGMKGKMIGVGDHRQAIYGFRGARVEIIAELWEEFKGSSDAQIVDLRTNFRSTPRVIDLANKWAETISGLRSMMTPPMTHGNIQRKDNHPSHIALIGFDERQKEAEWIADAVRVLVPDEKKGARHDKKDGSDRGLSLSDIAVLVRSSTDVRTFMRVLETRGVDCVVRAGPDLFSQPEVLLFLAAIAISAGQTQFFGGEFNQKSLPNRIRSVLGCDPIPESVLRAAGQSLREAGLRFDRETEDRLLFAAKAMNNRISKNIAVSAKEGARLRNPQLREFVSDTREIRRLFPQRLFHFLLSEAETEVWDTVEGHGQTALFHLGALSGLITGIETPGWTSVKDYPWQIIGLCQYGADEGRVREQPLMVKPDAVTISTIHSVKGLEFAAVFLADVCSKRFPSIFAKRKPDLPLDAGILADLDFAGLADNSNYDNERRLMYVALTRAERFLFVSHSGKQVSKFIKEMNQIVPQTGGTVTADSDKLLHDLRYAPKEARREINLNTSFSDLRYYLACPHDFYLRKVLGFSPTIDQAFGYGRGVHNLLRAVHTNPKEWAALVQNREGLEREIGKLIDRGLFYLRYTTGDPAENMRRKGLRVVADYIARYVGELGSLEFEPEKEFETLIKYGDADGGALISGAIDVIRQDDPPRVSVIDFKSGDPESDSKQKLDEDEMRLQVATYSLAAKKELEYQPEQGLVRYLGADDNEKRELKIPLDRETLDKAEKLIAKTAAKIRDRIFKEGPVKRAGQTGRCENCDFLGFCGMPEAIGHKKSIGSRN